MSFSAHRPSYKEEPWDCATPHQQKSIAQQYMDAAIVWYYRRQSVVQGAGGEASDVALSGCSHGVCQNQRLACLVEEAISEEYLKEGFSSNCSRQCLLPLATGRQHHMCWRC